MKMSVSGFGCIFLFRRDIDQSTYHIAIYFQFICSFWVHRLRTRLSFFDCVAGFLSKNDRSFVHTMMEMNVSGFGWIYFFCQDIHSSTYHQIVVYFNSFDSLTKRVRRSPSAIEWKIWLSNQKHRRMWVTCEDASASLFGCKCSSFLLITSYQLWMWFEFQNEKIERWDALRFDEF